MRVSIVTAVKNGAPVIGETLRSVEAQSYSNIEHVVIDGASTDGTREVVLREGKRVAVMRSAQDRGVYDAFNSGLMAASGDVIGFLNAGDTYEHAQAVAHIAAVFDDPKVDAVFGNLVITDPDQPDHILRHYRADGFKPSDLAMGMMPPHPTLFLRRRVYDTFGGYDPQYVIAGDFDLCLRIFLKGQTAFRHVPETLVRMPAGGLSNRGWRSIVANTREIRAACAANGVSTSLPRLMIRLPLKWLHGRSG